ncbi:hypothetical protein ONZ45_g5591 [Pleurotus djamor]|nr:hypothetical protein ONZ45_g5591 [Pleurotus djamor]
MDPVLSATDVAKPDISLANVPRVEQEAEEASTTATVATVVAARELGVYTCGGVGHLSRDCVQGSKCYNCNQTGHISRDCSQPQKRACYTCGSEGHISRDCPGAGADTA